MLTLISIGYALSAAGLTWYGVTTAREVTYATLADGRLQERPVPLLFRLLLPLAPNLGPLIRTKAFTQSRQKADKTIVSAGYDGIISGEELLALRALVPLFLGPIWCVMITVFVSYAPGRFGIALANNQNLLFAFGFLLLYTFPSSWLRDVRRKRHRSIQYALPFVLDLLTLSVEAGMDFMSALQRTVASGKVSALGEEMLRVIRQIQLGKTRREAMRDMISRVDQPDLTVVMSAMVQADELGVSMGSILRIQAEQVRRKRFENAERMANEAPVKLLGPLIFFIFPAVFLILLGPVIMQMMKVGF